MPLKIELTQKQAQVLIQALAAARGGIAASFAPTIASTFAEQYARGLTLSVTEGSEIHGWLVRAKIL